MMAAFRAFTKSWIAMGLMGILVISFAVWGVNDVFSGRISDWVVKAGDRLVTPDEYKRLFDQQLKDAQERVGRAVTAREAVAEGFDRQLLRDLADNEAMQELLRRSGLRPSDKLVADELRKSQAFFNPVTGAFDQQSYEQLLGQNGITPAQYERGLRDQIAMEHFTRGMVAGMRAPTTYAAVISTLLLQSRSAEALVVEPSQVGQVPRPTDAQLQAFIKQNEAAFRRPEFRQLSLVRFSAQAEAQKIRPDPAEVNRLFEQSRTRLSSPEKRSFVQIPVKDAGQAGQVAQRLRAGESPEAVARAVGVRPIVYTDAVKTGVADPRVGDAVFALPAGGVTGPVQGELGMSVSKLTGITAPKEASIAELRPQIEEQVRADAAQERVYDQVQKYDDAHGTGAVMADAARAAGVQVFQIPPITADGRMPDGRPMTGFNEKMLTDAFALGEGQETDVVDLGKGEYYAIRAEKILPAAVPPLDQIREAAATAYARREMVRRVEARAKELEARLNKGESVQQVAASAGARVLRIDSLNRQAAQQRQDLGGEFLQAMFDAKPGAVFSARMPNGIAVAKVTQVQAPTTEQAARMAEQQSIQVSVQMAQADFGQIIRQAARDAIEPKVDEKRARQAINVAEEDVPAGKAAPAPKDK